MKAMVKLAAAVLVVGAMFATAHYARAQQTSGQSRLVGTWMLVSQTAHQGDKTWQPIGPDPVGSFMFDQNGHFILLIARQGLPKFAANKKDAGTPEENKALLAGVFGYFGTYTVSEADQILTLHIKASTFPNWAETDQKRSFTILGDELKVISRTPAMMGAEVLETVFRRAP